MCEGCLQPNVLGPQTELPTGYLRSLSLQPKLGSRAAQDRLARRHRFKETHPQRGTGLGAWTRNSGPRGARKGRIQSRLATRGLRCRSTSPGSCLCSRPRGDDRTQAAPPGPRRQALPRREAPGSRGPPSLRWGPHRPSRPGRRALPAPDSADASPGRRAAGTRRPQCDWRSRERGGAGRGLRAPAGHPFRTGEDAGGEGVLAG